MIRLILLGRLQRTDGGEVFFRKGILKPGAPKQDRTSLTLRRLKVKGYCEPYIAQQNSVQLV